jgi:hypothetical protein
MMTSFYRPNFADLFFSQTLHQQFNRKGWEFESDDNEPAIRKFVRAFGTHETQH